MKKLISILAIAIVLISCFIVFIGCEKQNNGIQDNSSDNSDSENFTRIEFGKFTCGGKRLYSFKKVDIAYEEAYKLVSSSNNIEKEDLALSGENTDNATEYQIGSPEYYAQEYAMLTVTSKFYNIGETGELEVQIYNVELSGTDLLNALRNNEIVISTGVVVKDLIANSANIENFEKKNIEYRNDPMSIASPFRDIYTYHRNGDNFVLQTHNFVEIPSTEIGGMSASYIQENETIFDFEKKASKYQSSLGMKIQTKDGTIYNGIIFEVQFKWTAK